MSKTLKQSPEKIKQSDLTIPSKLRKKFHRHPEFGHLTLGDVVQTSTGEFGIFQGISTCRNPSCITVILNAYTIEEKWGDNTVFPYTPSDAQKEGKKIKKISNTVFKGNGKSIPIIYQVNTQPHKKRLEDIERYDRIMKYKISPRPRPTPQEEQFEEETEPSEENSHEEKSYIPW